MLNRLIELYHSGGFVMPPLLIGAAVLWFAMTHRLMLLSKGQLGSYFDFTRRLKDLKDCGQNKDDAYLLLSEEEDELNKYKVLTRTVVVIAPLLGLLGTVSGMIETFDSLADMSLFSQSGGIAGGISQALISTQMGLAVAIPGLIVGRLLEKRQSGLINDMEEQIENSWSPLTHQKKRNQLNGETHA
jgi:biopolymer transport protein ExbB